MTDQEAALCKAILDAHADDYISDLEVSIDGKRVTLTTQYECAPATFKTLSCVGTFFGTDRVNLVSRDCTRSGCETCNYGSEYQVVLEVNP